MRVVFDDQTVAAEAGDLLFYRAGRHHAEYSDPSDPVETRYMAFTSEVAATWTWTTLHDRDGRVRELISWLHNDWQARDPGAEDIRQAFTQAIVAECRRLMTTHEDPFLAKVHACMERDLARPLAVGDLADAVGLSPFHFIRRYRRLVGRTPMAELRRRRIEAARHLVATTDLPLADIPAKVGIADVQHLTRLFRQHLGSTPGGIRRLLYRA